MSFVELRKECRRLGLLPLGGKYITHAFLEHRLSCHKGEANLGEEEKRVYDHDNQFYFVIWPHVGRMPDA